MYTAGSILSPASGLFVSFVLVAVVGPDPCSWPCTCGHPNARFLFPVGTFRHCQLNVTPYYINSVFPERRAGTQVYVPASTCKTPNPPRSYGALLLVGCWSSFAAAAGLTQVCPRRGEGAVPVRAPRCHGVFGRSGGPSLGAAVAASGRYLDDG